MVPLEQDYEFDDMDAENIYKAIKRLRLDKEHYDKFGFIVFNFIFSENILKELDSKAFLWNQYLRRQKFDKYVQHETILNIQYFVYYFYPNIDWKKFIPTILKKFLDQEVFTEEFLINWAKDSDEIIKFFKSHCLYKDEYNTNLKQDAK